MSKTWGDVAKEFIACQTAKEAEAWLSLEIDSMVKEFGLTSEKAESNLRSSLGYMMGYYDDKTATRMHKLLNLSHPLLPWVGKMPTTEANLKKALRIGTLEAQK